MTLPEITTHMGVGEGEGWTGSLGLVDANYYFRMDKQQGPNV